MVRKLTSFLQENEKIIREKSVPIFVIAVAATTQGAQRVRDFLAQTDWVDIDFRVCDPLSDNVFAFQAGNGIWKSDDDRDRALSLCRDIGVEIYPNDPLGYGEQGLLVVFSDTCPNNSLPLIHSESRPSAKRKWTPLFLRIAN